MLQTNHFLNEFFLQPNSIDGLQYFVNPYGILVMDISLSNGICPKGFLDRIEISSFYFSSDIELVNMDRLVYGLTALHVVPSK